MFDFSVMGGSILQGIKDWIGESSSGNDQSDQPDSIKLLPVVAALAGFVKNRFINKFIFSFPNHLR